MSSFLLVKGQRMLHAAVNTDPLQLHRSPSNSSLSKQCHYGLKERNIPRTRISESNELHIWYDFGEKIGQGAFGVVLAVVEKSTSKNFAMKVVHKLASANRLTIIEREIQILKLIQHPHIIYLDKVFETSKKIFMVFERCYGELAKIYEERKPFIEDVAKIIIKQLMQAIAYLHKYDIVHRDVKMENILIGENPDDPTDEYYIKLTDFGLSIVKCGKGIESMLTDFCGTLYYMAPEIITRRSYSQQCDVWAIGVILYMLVSGKYPFNSDKEEELQKQICSGALDFTSLSHISPEAIHLIRLLLNKDPVNRLSASEALNHAWTTNRKLSRVRQQNILQMMKDWKPEMTKVPAGEESDWVSSVDLQTVLTKQPLELPKTNINFDRKQRKQSIRSIADDSGGRKTSLIQRQRENSLEKKKLGQSSKEK